MERLPLLLGGDWTDDEFQELFIAVDKNEDKKIQYEEFVDWVMGDDAAKAGIKEEDLAEAVADIKA